MRGGKLHSIPNQACHKQRYLCVEQVLAIPADLWCMVVLRRGEEMKINCWKICMTAPALRRHFRTNIKRLRNATRCSSRYWKNRSVDWSCASLTPKDHIIESLSIDSCISGFWLAWKLSAVLGYYKLSAQSLVEQTRSRAFILWIKQNRKKMKYRQGDCI